MQQFSSVLWMFHRVIRLYLTKMSFEGWTRYVRRVGRRRVGVASMVGWRLVVILDVVGWGGHSLRQVDVVAIPFVY